MVVPFGVLRCSSLHTGLGNLQYDEGADFARLLLAWGLSQEETELPVLKPPSEIEDEVRRIRDYQDGYVDKDVC